VRVLLVSALAAASASVPLPARSDGAVAVGPTVQVSRSGPERAHEEVYLGAHPTDPKRLLACSIVDRNRYAERAMHGVAYVTEDGGATWRHAAESTEFNGDPMCAFAPDGRAFFLSIGTDDENWKNVNWWMEIFRSDDGGRTWGPGEARRGGDRPYIAFDAGDGKRPAAAYVVYAIRATALDRKGPFETMRDAALPTIEVIRSNDGGRTWGKVAVGVSEGPGFPTATGAAVLSDGTLAVLWLERFTKKDESGKDVGQDDRETLNVSLAAPGAEIFQPTVRVAELVGSRPDSGTFFSFAADASRGAFRDRLYAAWTDTATPRTRILVASSSDGGRSWSAPVAVNTEPGADPAKALDDYQPTVAVNRDGVVGVTWRRRTRNEDDAEVRFASSRDGGSGWSPSILVSRPSGPVAGGLAKARLGPADDGETPASRREESYKGGDTAGLAADANGVFHAVWADQRSGIGQVYTAAIDLGGAPASAAAAPTTH
jgi:hypothetical protein